MIINVHAHLFTLRTVLSRDAIRVITQRLTDKGFPDFFVQAVERFLDDLLDRPEVLDEREVLARLFAKLLGTAGFNNLLDTKLAGLPIIVTLRSGRLEDLPVDALRRALDSITSALEDGSKVGKSPFDLVATLRISMRPTITDVADELLAQMGADDALVALMMDIHGPDDPPRDRESFLRQVHGTEEAALQRPGRVLPFFGVHPDREDHFELMKEAIEKRGFLGVKLYPSLGYEIGHPKLMEVYRYCVDQDVPVLLHCGHGGFYRKQEYIDYCDPRHWIPVLRGDLESLRVCFAHFGGWQSLGTPEGLNPGTWGHTILELMRSLPNVFTDLAYHTDQMTSPERTSFYFQSLAVLLQDAKLQRRILFGTDSWLLRLDLLDIDFRNHFEQHMSAADFRKIAELAPREFLGFPPQVGGALQANLRRYVDHMAAGRSSVGAEPAEWLQDLVGQPFEQVRASADWNIHRDACARTYQGLANLLTSAQKHKGFKANRTLPLRELTYFKPRDPNFGFTCEDRARKFLQFAGQGVRYRGTYDDDSAVTLFATVFRKGEKQLAEVAALLDSVFEYPRALV